MGKTKTQQSIDELRAELRKGMKRVDQIEQALITREYKGSVLDSMNFLIQLMKAQQGYLTRVENQVQDLQTQIAEYQMFHQEEGSLKRFANWKIDRKAAIEEAKQKTIAEQKAKLDEMRKEAKRLEDGKTKEKEAGHQPAKDS